MPTEDTGPYATGEDLEADGSTGGSFPPVDIIAKPMLYLEDSEGNDVTESEDRLKLDNLRLYSSEFNCLGADVHKGSEWELADNDTFENIIESKSVYGRTVDKTSWNPSLTLENGIPYSMRVKHVGSNNGDSKWSNIIIVERPLQISDLEFGTPFEGGYYAGIIDTSGTRYAVIVAPKDGGETTESLKWKTTRSLTSGATSKWDGFKNTNTLNRDTHPPIMFVFDLNENNFQGYGDWYVPAVDELELVYRNLKSIDKENNVYASDSRPYASSNRRVSGYNPSSDPKGAEYTKSNPAQTNVELFKQGNSEAFKNWTKYWTSTDYTNDFTYVQQMYDGSQSREYKTNGHSGYAVRAIRRVIIED